MTSLSTLFSYCIFLTKIDNIFDIKKLQWRNKSHNIAKICFFCILSRFLHFFVTILLYILIFCQTLVSNIAKGSISSKNATYCNMKSVILELFVPSVNNQLFNQLDHYYYQLLSRVSISYNNFQLFCFQECYFWIFCLLK